jgi:hypothetical protein
MTASEAFDTTPSSPLRNRLRLRLAAPVSDVWELVGNLSRFPEYSQGLDKVDAEVTGGGACTGYVCHFKPMGEGEEGVIHRERMSWYAAPRGWASIADEENPFGLSNSLTVVTLEPADGETQLTWAQYYEAQDAEMMQAVFDEALADIGQNLTRRFGGEIVDRSVGNDQV